MRNTTHFLSNQETKLPPKILLVEDDKLTQVIYQRFLEKLGCHVTLVATGKAAIDHAAQGNYQAMLLDIGLPDIRGETVISTIRIREKRIKTYLPIIVATAHGDETTLEDCKARGADAAFIKPISQVILARIIDKLL